MLPYVPASTKQVENVMKALSNNSVKGKKLIDLGSGDGRIVIAWHYHYCYSSPISNCLCKVLAAGQKGFQSHGVELNR